MIRLGPLHLRDFDAHRQVEAGGRLRRLNLRLPEPLDVVGIDLVGWEDHRWPLRLFVYPSEAEVVAYQLADALRGQGYPAIARGATVGLAGAFETE